MHIWLTSYYEGKSVAISEPLRHRLHDGLKEAIGDENAGNLMQMLPPFSWEELARRSDLDDLRGGLEGKIEAVETKIEVLHERIDVVELKIDALDFKFTGKLDSLVARVVLANVGTTIGICGLLLAALKLGL